jgi:hypothetical protein
VAKLHGQYFVVTNQHVLSGNQKFTLTGMDGTKYPTDGPLYGAVDYDIAILRIPPAKYALEVLDDPVASAQVGDPLMVPGNPDGAGVITQTPGKLLGLGPQLVEVDAKFVHGNSGSPIIHEPSGKVIGVATYAITVDFDELKQASQASKLRWFGYRLDNIKEWRAIDWQKFSEEGQQLRQIESLTDALVTALSSPDPNGDNDQVNQAMLEYQVQIHRATTAAAQRQALLNLIAHLHTFARYDDDIKDLVESDPYPFHAEMAHQQEQLRAQIEQALETFESALNGAQ